MAYNTWVMKSSLYTHYVNGNLEYLEIGDLNITELLSKDEMLYFGHVIITKLNTPGRSYRIEFINTDSKSKDVRIIFEGEIPNFVFDYFT